MKFSHLVYLTLLALFISGSLHGQQKKKHAEVLLKEAKAYMVKEDFRRAEAAFREILSLNELISRESLYFFAYTLEKNHRLQSSQNFLEKYLQMTGKSGEYYNEATILKNRLDKLAVEIEACHYCDHDGFRLTTCTQCGGAGQLMSLCNLCHGFGQITCRKCLGEGVQISKNSFGDNVYKTCEVCNGSGKELCDRCLGAKHLMQECSLCKGTGKSGSDVLCNHKKNLEIP